MSELKQINFTFWFRCYRHWTMWFLCYMSDINEDTSRTLFFNMHNNVKTILYWLHLSKLGCLSRKKMKRKLNNGLATHLVLMCKFIHFHFSTNDASISFISFVDILRCVTLLTHLIHRGYVNYVTYYEYWTISSQISHDHQ